MRHTGRHILTAAALAFLAAFLVWPVLRAVGGAFYERGQFTLEWIAAIFSNQVTRDGLLNALQIAMATTAASTLLALPLAVLADRVAFRGRSYASALLLVPMILPPFVGALSFQKLLSLNYGPINLLLQRVGLPHVDLLGGGSFWLVVILEALHLYPIMYLNTTAALANIDPAMTEAARNLGARRWRTFRRITLPLMGPGLFAGATIVFIWSFCELGTPLMVNYDRVLPVQIYRGFIEQADPRPDTFAMVFVLLGSSVSLYVLGRALFGRPAAAMAGRASIAAARKPAGWLASAGCWAAFGFVAFLAILPHIGVVLMAVAKEWNTTVLPVSYTAEHLLAVFRDEQTWNSILNSLRYAGASTAGCAVAGVVIAYLVVRLRVRGATLLDAGAMLPLAVPGLVMAAGYVAVTQPGSRLEAIGPSQDPTLLLIVAYTVRRLPYMTRSISAGLQQTSETLEEAARNLGASRVRAVLRVTVPLVMANILAGAILTFSFNMLEVSDSLILAQAKPYYPITKQLYDLGRSLNTEAQAAALGVYGMVLLTTTLVLANVLLGKRMGQLFRV